MESDMPPRLWGASRMGGGGVAGINCLRWLCKDDYLLMMMVIVMSMYMLP